MNQRKQQLIATEKKIVAVSKCLFEEYGFEKVSVDQICKETGISKGGFYHHFDSKNNLIASIIGDELDSELGAKLFPLIGHLPTRKLLEIYAETLIVYHKTRHKNIITKYWHTLADAEDISEILNNRCAFTVMDAIARQGLSNKDFNNKYTVEFCSHFLTATITGLFIHWNGFHDSYPLRPFVEQSIDLIFLTLR